MEQIIGNDHLKQFICDTISSRKISNSYLFCGEKGLGKSTFCKLFAKSILCPKNSLSLCDCLSCKKINRGVHPDLIEISPEEKGNVPIEKIKMIRQTVNISPNESTFKVYIIKEVEKLSVQASNSLLKTLEQPPKNVVFLLTASSKFKVIKTISSRCICLNVQPVSDDRMKQFLMNKYNLKSSEKINTLVGVCGGNIGKAIYLAENKEGQKAFEITGNLINALTKASGVEVLKALAPLEKQKEVFLLVLSLFSKEIEKAFLKRVDGVTENNLKGYNANRLIKMYRAAQKTSNLLEANANLRLNLTCFAAQIST